MKRRYLMLFSIILIILTLGVVSAGDVDVTSNDADILASADYSVDLSASVEDVDVASGDADGILESVDDSVDLSVSVEDVDAVSTDDSVDLSESVDSDDIIADDDYVSGTYVELNSYDLFSDNPHSVNIYNGSDYVAIIHAPTQSEGTAHLSIGKNDGDAIEIFSSSVQELYKEIDGNDDDYSYYYIRPDDIDVPYVPDIYYVLVEYKRGLTSLTDFDEGYVNFVEDSRHVRVEAPPEIVIGDFDSSYILIFVEGTKGNLRVWVDGKEVLNDSVYNLRYINETDEFRYYIPIFLDNLSIGTHTYSVSYYDGNWDNVTIYDTIDVTYLLEVYPNLDESYYDLPFYIDSYPFIYGDNVTFSILLPDDAKSSEIKVNGKAYEIFPINGLASLTLSDFELGENILNFIYDDPYYGEKSYSLFLQVNPWYIPSTVPSGSNDGIRLRLPSDAQGKLNISIWDDEEYDWHFVESIDLVNGQADYAFDDYPWTIGTHKILVEFDGEEYSFVNETTIEIIPNVVYNNVSIGQMAALSINLIGMKGNVTVTLNGENLTTNELNYFGKTIVIIFGDKLNVGKNIFTISYEGDSSIVPFAYYNLNIGKYIPSEYELWVEPVFSAPTEFSESGGTEITLDLPEGTSGNITVYVNDEAISTIPVHSGENNITVSGLSYGNNTVKFVYIGDDGETYEFNRIVNVPKKKVTIDVAIPAVTKIPQFAVNLPSDATGSLYAVVEGEIYRVDLKNGQATIIVPNLTNGVYDVKVYYDGDAKYGAFMVEVPILINIAPDLKDPKLTIKVPSVYKGKKVKVTITTVKSFTGKVKVKIKNKTYTVKVVNGKGTLSVSGLAVGTYTATVTFSANKVYKSSKKSVKFKVKKNVYKLGLKKVKVKKSLKKLTITASLKINGKIAKGKKLTFKFNKNVYKAKTNKKGVAKIVIKKSVLKKLKAGKKITYQVSYGKKVLKRKVKVAK